jgi:alginate O-acetyltransferase complex protein AlgJ
MRSTRPLLIGAFSLLIALPGLQMTHPLAPEVALSGVLIDTKKPRFTLAAWWQGEFQSQAEGWLDDHIGFRGHAVRTENQIGLSLFHEAWSKAVDSVLLGRRMMVYGDAYVMAYDGITDFTDRTLRKRVRDMRRLQVALARRGVAFVFLISPSKASIYPEYLPTGFVRPDGQRPKVAYERMLPMLESAGVQVVDGHAIFEEEKGRSPHALFPPGGVHWNRYSASLVLRRAWQRLGEQLGRPLVELRCRSVIEDDTPAGADQEMDGADLLNAWHVGHADWKFPRPNLHTDDADGGLRPKVLVVGDSFWWVPDTIIAAHKMASRYDFFYYFNDPEHRPYSQNRPMVGHPSGLHPGMSWEYVFSADAIIVEANEGVVGAAGWGFIEAAVKQLDGDVSLAAGKDQVAVKAPQAPSPRP